MMPVWMYRWTSSTKDYKTWLIGKMRLVQEEQFVTNALAEISIDVIHKKGQVH